MIDESGTDLNHLIKMMNFTYAHNLFCAHCTHVLSGLHSQHLTSFNDDTNGGMTEKKTLNLKNANANANQIQPNPNSTQTSGVPYEIY